MTSFKYLGANLCKEGTCSTKVYNKIASAMARLNCKQNLGETLSALQEAVQISFHLHLLNGCETWTLLADSENTIQAFETKCMRKLLRISYLEHKTNVVHRNLFWQLSTETCMVQARHTPQPPLQTIPQGTLEGGRHRGVQRN